MLKQPLRFRHFCLVLSPVDANLQRIYRVYHGFIGGPLITVSHVPMGLPRHNHELSKTSWRFRGASQASVALRELDRSYTSNVLLKRLDVSHHCSDGPSNCLNSGVSAEKDY